MKKQERFLTEERERLLMELFDRDCDQTMTEHEQHEFNIKYAELNDQVPKLIEDLRIKIFFYEGRIETLEEKLKSLKNQRVETQKTSENLLHEVQDLQKQRLQLENGGDSSSSNSTIVDLEQGNQNSQQQQQQQQQQDGIMASDPETPNLNRRNSRRPLLNQNDIELSVVTHTVTLNDDDNNNNRNNIHNNYIRENDESSSQDLSSTYSSQVTSPFVESPIRTNSSTTSATTKTEINVPVLQDYTRDFKFSNDRI